ncbi:MAG: hypothetical protein NXI20_24075 [bacterium]|nr:hypothetical protein [bacterium]
MSFFDKVYQKVFGKPEPSKASIVHEPIKRDSKFQFYYEEWKASTNSDDLLQQIIDSYNLKLQKEDSIPKVHILNSPYSNGLAISYDKSVSERDFEYLLDLFRDRILDNLGYRLEVSDRLITEKKNHIETKQKHYLKPVRPKEEGLIPQLYGNILLEHIQVNNEPSYLRIQANTYNDQLFEKPDKFEGLLETILKVKS